MVAPAMARVETAAAGATAARSEQAISASPRMTDSPTDKLQAAARPGSPEAAVAVPQAQPVAPEHTVDRNRFYISQMGDRKFGSGGLFGCGATSLTMACADFNAPGFSHPPTEDERVRVMNETGVMAQGQFPGGPSLMAQEAQKRGLSVEDKANCTDINALDEQLAQGRGCIVNGPHHFIYVAGKAPDGTYIVGDPASPGVTHWTKDHLSSFLTNSPVKGFTAVWSGDGTNQPRIVTNDGGAGNTEAPFVPRGDQSAIGQSGGGGGNGSMFGGDNSGTGGGIPQRLSDTPAGVATGSPGAEENQFYNSLPADQHLLMSALTDKIVGNLAKNAGSFDSINKNDSGHGLSVGMLQWNQRVGGLPELLQKMLENDPELFKKLFPDLFKQFVGPDGKIDEEKLRNFDFSGGPEADAMLGELKKGLSDPKMKEVQLALARENVVSAEKIGLSVGIKSDSALATLCDALNQAGPKGVQAAMERAGLTPDKVAQIGEPEALKLFNQSLAMS
ncbi:MAG: hypothetical protein EKK48_23500 [Candidatus Melainabacteria bacterium]|nr:MAG: hypothetical protein EKK48_23500 [Candidatus Melainabacteria bacterium]